MVPPVVQNDLSTLGQDLDISGNISEDSWSSLELDEPVPPPPASQGQLNQRQLKGKVQARVQGRVNDFWKEKIGRYIMQGDYLALVMEEGSCVTWRSYLWDIPQ